VSPSNYVLDFVSKKMKIKYRYLDFGNMAKKVNISTVHLDTLRIVLECRLIAAIESSNSS
jgi:hypothetical protein